MPKLSYILHPGTGVLSVHERKKVFIRSMGCKVNLADAARIVDMLHGDSFELVGEPELADTVILNTCTVTHKADRDSRKFLGSLASRFPDLPVIVTGCGAVNQGERYRDYPNVKEVFLPGSEKRIAESLDPGSECDLQVNTPRSSFFRLGRKRAFLKVQDGCNARCSYCTIPLARGPQRSMDPVDVLTQVRRLLDAGHKELVLTGIHLGRYGFDLSRRVALSELLEELAPEFQHRSARLRLSSIEPNEWTDELLESISKHDFICHHFHVPLQSGHNEILHRMARPYTTEQYLETIERLRRAFPKSAIGADVMVGFPTETDEMAESTARFAQSLDLNYLHVFTFSARPGTVAFSMAGKVSEKNIKERAGILRDIGHRKWRNFCRSGLGETHVLLGEKTKNGNTEGKSEHYRRLRLMNGKTVGKLIRVKATSMDGDILLCELAQEKRN